MVVFFNSSFNVRFNIEFQEPFSLESVTIADRKPHNPENSLWKIPEVYLVFKPSVGGFFFHTTETFQIG